MLFQSCHEMPSVGSSDRARTRAQFPSGHICVTAGGDSRDEGPDLTSRRCEPVYDAGAVASAAVTAFVNVSISAGVMTVLIPSFAHSSSLRSA